MNRGTGDSGEVAADMEVTFPKVTYRPIARTNGVRSDDDDFQKCEAQDIEDQQTNSTAESDGEADKLYLLSST